MAPIEWKPAYSVGVADVDHEHRELIGLVNATAGAILEGAPPEAVERCFGDLLRAIGAHFALEERFMREAGYDRLAQHKADHERLLDRLRDIMDRADQDRDSVAGALVGTLEEWFAAHFRTHDARLHGRLGPHPHD
jgi:hemerythrin-like metal-binding protein